MNRSRLLALAVSVAVAAALGWFGWRWIQERRAPKSLELRKMTQEGRPIGSPRDWEALGTDKARTPVKPEEWTFFLDERQAARFFPIEKNWRGIYDPWCFIRDPGHLEIKMKWPEHPEHAFTWITNSLGCREDHELDDPPRDLRVLVAGDSHACGVCNNDESLANRLEVLLAAANPGRSVEVLNTGFGGYSFLNYLGTLLRFRDFKPQVFVVAVFGGNDFGELLPLFLYTRGRMWPTMTKHQEARRMGAVKISADVMGQGFSSLDNLRNWPDKKRVLASAAVQIFAEMRRICDEQGTKLIVAFIPCPFEFKWEDSDDRIAKVRAKLELTDDDMRINDELRDVLFAGLRKYGIQALDLEPVFAAEPQPPYWLRDFHLSVRGHDLAAQALEPLVETALRSAKQ